MHKKQEDCRGRTWAPAPIVRNLTEALGNVYNKGTGFSTWFPG
jgi:hypothetical protein